jgi:hypothetical protein
VSNDKVRLESRCWSDTVLLVNFGNHTATVFFPSQKAYQQLADTPEQYFRVSDAENACPDWQKALGKEVTCAKIGSETVGGATSHQVRRQGCVSSKRIRHVCLDRSCAEVCSQVGGGGRRR